MSQFEARPSVVSPEVAAERSRSFGQAAAHYERYRPGPLPEAVAWLLPTPVGTVVDLGAGTGALTRLLTGRATRVIAVEPDERMRAVLQVEVPGITVVEGRGESMPLPDGVADAVVASSSWHWVEPVPGFREVARVLRPGGVLGVMWSGPDLDSPFIAQARLLLGGVGADHPGAEGAVETLRAMSDNGPASRSVLQVPDGMPFSEPECETFRWDMALTADELIGLLGTFSWVITMGDGGREALLTTARRLLRDALGVHGEVTVDLTFRCDTYRSRLLG